MKKIMLLSSILLNFLVICEQLPAHVLLQKAAFRSRRALIAGSACVAVNRDIIPLSNSTLVLSGACLGGVLIALTAYRADRGDMNKITYDQQKSDLNLMNKFTILASSGMMLGLLRRGIKIACAAST